LATEAEWSGPGEAIFLGDPDHPERRDRLLKADEFQPLVGAGWSGDEARAWVMRQQCGSCRAIDLGVIDLSTRRVLGWAEGALQTYYYDGVSKPLFSLDNRKLYYPRAEGEQGTLFAYDVDAGRSAPVAKLPLGFHGLVIQGWDDPTTIIATLVHFQSRPDTPSQVVLIHITTGEVRPITRLMPPYTSVLSIERLP